MADARMNLSRADAAQARALKVRDPSARPSQRLADRASGSPRGWTPAVRARIEPITRAAGEAPTTVRFEGFASVTGQFYDMYDMFGPYVEQVHVGAFTETLSQPDLDVPLVLDHISSKRIARTGNRFSPLKLEEVSDGAVTGLRVVAPELQMSDTDTAYIVQKLQHELIDEMSFRFMITSGRWSDDWSEYHIHAVDLHRGDVSIVGYGANPLTTGAGLRAAPAGNNAAARALLALSEADDDRYRRRVR